jgi:transcriptional regulator with GAF, ATPase, and Fis domain
LLQTKTFQSDKKSDQNIGYLYLPKNSGSHEVIEINEFITIGRDPHCLLELEDPFVSSRHVRIERNQKGFVLRDMRSRNGTFVNGARVAEAFLEDRDMITLGNTQIQFRFQTEDEEQEAFLKSQNTAWQAQLEKFPSVAESEMPVLILGESGTGKELIARTLHRLSPRKHAPLVSVNCSALGDSLVESELFGHRKGSFTDATHDRKGAFESARGGTLFLDEIGDLPLNLQPKLLRALENQEIRPVGSDSAVKTDVRILAATHQDLQQKVLEGDFREDLYFRLNVVKVTPPPLRHRVEDFETLLYQICREYKIAFSQLAILELKKQDWRGNIRELKIALQEPKPCLQIAE